MTKSWIVKRCVVLVGVCLALAWIGATHAAEPKMVSTVDVPAGDEGLRLIKSDCFSQFFGNHRRQHANILFVKAEDIRRFLGIGISSLVALGYRQLQLAVLYLGDGPPAGFVIKEIDILDGTIPVYR